MRAWLPLLTRRRHLTGVGLTFAVLLAAATGLLLTNTRESGRVRGQEEVTDPLTSGHMLIDKDGQPFFWMGDTAWLLAQRTTREDVELYLSTRAAQGVTVIQATAVMTVLNFNMSVRTPNVYGDLPFHDGDMSMPLSTPGSDPNDAAQYDYWDHLNFIIDRAASIGLTIALLPAFIYIHGDGYQSLNVHNAYPYGRFLGERYAGRSNIIWVLGGDNTPDSNEKKAIWREMARAITEAKTGGVEDYTATTMTYHVAGQKTSTDYFHDEPWLDFNMNQPGGFLNDTHKMMSNDYDKRPAKPVVMSEGAYEDGPQYGFPVDALAIRKQIYWSYMSGGYFTYGNTNTWNFGTHPQEVNQDWKAALHAPGARALSIAREILFAINWFAYVPDQSIFAAGRVGRWQAVNTAMRSIKGDGLFIYLASPTEVTIRMDKITAASSVTATWINPADGQRLPAGTFSNSGQQRFTTPDPWPDAVLIITPP